MADKYKVGQYVGDVRDYYLAAEYLGIGQVVEVDSKTIRIRWLDNRVSQLWNCEPGSVYAYVLPGAEEWFPVLTLADATLRLIACGEDNEQ